MKKYVLYAHGGSGNHGCEALVRTTAELLDYKKNEMIVISSRPEEDKKYKVNELCTLIKKGTIGQPKKCSWEFIKATIMLKLFNNYKPMDILCEGVCVETNKGDIALSIGGDSYCYGELSTDNLIYENIVWKKAGLKTVLWGCSIEPELLEDPKIRKDIQNFDLITARETISYNALKKVNANTVLVSDSAFSLKKVELPLPDSFKNSDLVGINLSPLIEECEKVKGITRENYYSLIEKILNETDMKILLIPHVVWDKKDDRTVLLDLYEKYKSSNRVLLIDDHTCEELKGYISRCRFFVGARTHATIAAYSSSVPTLVVGYSVKARGIAEDLFGTSENYVLPVQNLSKNDDLVKGFDWLLKNEDNIKNRLIQFIPEYVKRINVAVEALNKLNER